MPSKSRRYQPESGHIYVGGESIEYELFTSGFVDFVYCGSVRSHRLKVNQTAKELVADKVFRLSLPEMSRDNELPKVASNGACR